MYTNKRYFVAFALIFAQFARALLITAYAPLATTVAGELSFTGAMTGSLFSIVNLALLLFLFIGNGIAGKIGLKNAFGMGVFLLAVGDSLAIFAADFPLLLISRALIGVGTGIFTPCVGGLNMQWFPPEEKGLIAALTSAFAFGGTYVAYALTIPFMRFLDGWRATLGIYGAVVFAVAVLWMWFGSENRKFFEAQEEERKKKGLNGQGSAPQGMQNNLSAAFARREVKILMFCYFCVYWAYTALVSYLPSFYQIVRGLDPGSASSLTSIFPLVGLVAGILAGLLSRWLGLRKTLMVPAFMLMFVCSLGALLISPDNAFLPVVVGLLGVGSASHNSLWMGVTMEMDNSTPAIVTGSYTLVFGVGYGASILSPMVYGWLVDSYGPQNILIACSFMILAAGIGCIFLPETGLRAQRQTA
jgi:predicted MFS family arabinose efflux permease